MEFHEYANLFPMMTPEEMQALKTDIRENGFRPQYPILLFENKILDGRNRYTAALAEGVEPIYGDYTGDDPLQYVISSNLNRRHLNESQRGVIGARLANMGIGRNWNNSENFPNKVSQLEAAERLNVSDRTIRTAKKIEREAPELIPEIEAGNMTLNKAITEMKRRDAIENLSNIDAVEAKEIDGIYDVIVIDPPWPIQKIERDVAPNQVAFEYPVMTVEEITEMEIPHAESCHLFLWTTQKYLPYSFGILKSWGFKYICTFVWHKPGGFQPYNLPQYNCEFVLYARIGSPIFLDFKDFLTCFDAPRKGHSEKPEEFYDTLRRVTGGRRLDMFNRRFIDGFDGWGKEAK